MTKTWTMESGETNYIHIQVIRFISIEKIVNKYLIALIINLYKQHNDIIDFLALNVGFSPAAVVQFN